MFNVNSRQVWIFLIIISLLLNIFFFRGIIGCSFQPDCVLQQEELVPYFNLDTQLMDNIFSTHDELLDRTEIRAEYFFVTSWARYYQILPISLVLFSTLSLILIYYGLLIFYRTFLDKNPDKKDLFALYTIALIPFLLLLLSKLTHFYSLIIGFAIFFLEIILFLAGIKNKNKKYLIISGALFLFNPAIHFILLSFLLKLSSLFIFWKKIELKYFISALFIPFGLKLLQFSYFILNSSAVSGSVEVYYNLFSNSKIGLLRALTLEPFSQISSFFSGYYLTPEYGFLALSIIIFSLIGSLFISNQKRSIKNIYFFLISITLISLSLQTFNLFPSPYYLFLKIFNYDVPSFLQKLAFLIANIFRYPHRFQFLTYFSLPLLISISYYIIRQKLIKNKGILNIILILLVFSIFSIYSVSLVTSGDFNGFLSEKKIENDLIEIKTILKEVSDTENRVIVLPFSGMGTRLNNIKGASEYIDPFLLWQINVPSKELASSTDYKNIIKGVKFVEYTSRNDIENFKLLAQENNISFILINNDLYRKDGKIYLSKYWDKKESRQIIEGIYTFLNENNESFTSLYKGEKYSLIKISHSKKENSSNSINNIAVIPFPLTNLLNEKSKNVKSVSMMFTNVYTGYFNNLQYNIIKISESYDYEGMVVSKNNQVYIKLNQEKNKKLIINCISKEKCKIEIKTRINPFTQWRSTTKEIEYKENLNEKLNKKISLVILNIQKGTIYTPGVIEI
jgi:hypothetical protein